MYYLLGAILWVIFAFWPAIVARRKGHSFILFFILSLFFFVLALIYAYAVNDNTETTEDIAAEKAVNKVMDEELHPEQSSYQRCLA